MGFLSSSSSTAEEQEAGLQEKFPNDEYNQIMILVNWLAAFGFIFATLKDHVGVRSIELQIPAQTNVAGLKSLLVEKFPMLRGLMSHMLISVNREYVFDDAIIHSRRR